MKNNQAVWYVAVVVAFIAGYLFAGSDWSKPNKDGERMSSAAPTVGDEAAAPETSRDEATNDQGVKTNENPAGFTLTGYALEQGGVHLSWVVPENRRAAEKFLVVRGTEADPVHDGDHYWLRTPGTRTEIDWSDVPDGETNFRVCILEGDTCVEYSNNLTLTVKKK